jgi:hypothetical protein
MPRTITPATSVENLKKEAKRWLKALRAHDPDARARIVRAYPDAPAEPVLRDVQYALAREYGCASWIALTQALAGPTVDYDRLANDLLAAFNSRDESALQRLNDQYGRAFTFDDLWAEVWRRLYSFRQRASGGRAATLERAEAETLIANDAGFASWAALTGTAAARTARVPPYIVDTEEDRIGPRRRLTDAEWDELIGVMKERRITGLDAGGLMNDRVLARVAALDQVTSLGLGGSRELTDDGLLQLARMPQLERLDLSEYPGGRLTDRGFGVLRHLPNLRAFAMTWQLGVTDAGVVNLKFCDRLERVDLMGSHTGDGAIEALRGKPTLEYVQTGRRVTDAGLALLHEFPALTHLLVDGPFTNEGLARIAALERLAELDLFWHVTGITADGFAHLVRLPNLTSLGADNELSNDAAMASIAQMPALRKLRAQNSVATDAGWDALSRSRTLEQLWGRECPNFASRGFVALSKMPALRILGISCKNVSDEALATLPDFPALSKLTPIHVTDAGFAHVGRCARLEDLSCMYCRDTTDVSTAHIANLRLKTYYAGLTQITDRSLEIFGRMDSLEAFELYEVKGVTDAGITFLAGLPRLRTVDLSGMPHVTFEGTRVFPPRVRVRYST